jgi:acetyl esterase
MTPEQARALANPIIAQMGGVAESVEKVENLDIPGSDGDIPIRVYTPKGKAPFPVLVYFHGGGWVIGNLDTHDSLCRSLANNAGCVVVSVGYRLSPENKFPAAVNDAYTATQWTANNGSRIQGDATRIAVAGDSSGGTLAAAVALMARDKGGLALVYQVLIYPALNLASFDTASYHDYGTGYMLTTTEMEWYRGHYLARQEDAQNPYASPLLASDFGKLPQALIITGEMDVLTSEGEAYANRLRQAGVVVRYHCYEGMIHPFLSLRAVVSRAGDAVAEISETLAAAFA